MLLRGKGRRVGVRRKTRGQRRARPCWSLQSRCLEQPDRGHLIKSLRDACMYARRMRGAGAVCTSNFVSFTNHASRQRATLTANTDKDWRNESSRSRLYAPGNRKIAAGCQHREKRPSPQCNCLNDVRASHLSESPEASQPRGWTVAENAAREGQTVSIKCGRGKQRPEEEEREELRSIRTGLVRSTREKSSRQELLTTVVD